MRLVPLLGRPPTGFSAPPHCCKRTRGEPNLLYELCRLGVLDPEPKRPADPLSRLVDRPAIRVTAAEARDARDPGASLVALEDDAVSTGVD